MDFSFSHDNDTNASSSSSFPSPPTYTSPIWKHHVFASFSGSDVGRCFMSNIMSAFQKKGIGQFKDCEISRGMSLEEELKETIRGSKIAIVFLSTNYASSSWCLTELVEIMKCREELRQIVMTVFYKVDPTDVEKQTGDFGKAFRKTCEKETEEHTESWRKALHDVANIDGEHSNDWSDEGDMIEKIVTDVSNMLNISTPSADFDGLVGMRAHMEMMEKLLRLDLKEKRMIGIWGPSGIGKTTIARVLYNQTSDRFQLGTFMVDIKRCYPRPCLDEYNAQLQLQKQMISHLGVAKEELKDNKVFLVLDDVDLIGQLNALEKEIRGFGPGSRIIVLTENLRLLKAYNINHIYKVNLPSWDEAFQMFCIHAFGQKHPVDGFDQLSCWDVMTLAGNIPSELKVLGSFVRGLSIQEWEKALPRLLTYRNLKEAEIVKSYAPRERPFIKSLMDVKVKPPQFQVFINYRGHLRNNFVGYLVDSLRRSEINVNIDYKERRGEDLNILFKRIEDSGIAIVVFSSTYTESKWCLEELVKIKERVDQGLLKVLPIFYEVTPTNVKRLKGGFGDHFRDKEYMYASDEPLIKRWKEAIMFVSHKFALTWDATSNVLEVDFLETIVKEVLEMLQAISKEESWQSPGNRLLENCKKKTKLC